MKIGVMSDTHGSLLYLEKALDILHECDVILHGGDVLYHGPRNDIPKGYNPKEFISKLNEVGNIIIAKGNSLIHSSLCFLDKIYCNATCKMVAKIA